MNETAVPVRTTPASTELAETGRFAGGPEIDRAGRALGWMPAERLSAPWVEEPAARVELAIRRAQAGEGGNPMPVIAGAAPLHGWLARVEDLLDRLLPGHLGSLLQLFICVSLTMAMISAMLPLVDRL